MKRKTPKELLAVERTQQEWMDIRRKAQDVQGLRENKKINGFVSLSIWSDKIEDNVLDMELTRGEYAFIRRYLLKKRIREMHKLGIDV
jgi:hypothetical protein